MIMLKTFAATLLAGTMLAGLAPTGALAEGNLALVGPQTGQYASFFVQMKRGAEGAVAAINAAGGINGKPITLDVEDDACDPKQAVAVANKVVSAGDAGIIGHFCSSSSIPASDVYSEGGIPMISPGSTNPKLTERGLKDVFRTCGRDDQQAAVAADAIVSKKLGTKIAIVDDKSTYGKGLADGVREALVAKGLKPVVDDTVTQGDKDFSTLISKLKAANVDFVFYGGYYAEAGLFIRQAREQGLEAKIMGGDGIAATELGSIAGKASDGLLMTFYPDPRNNPKAASIVKAFRDAKYEPEGYTLYTYAAVQAYAEAAKRAGSMDGAKVADELHKGSYETVIGKVSFDAKGDPSTEPFVVYIWKDGKYLPLT
jgi:branched-chain amino acid transport system substrate-binding protein